MAFRILPNGAYECDTLDEFRQLQRQRPTERKSRPQPTHRRAAANADAGLNEPAKAFLSALLRSSSTQNTDEIEKATGIKAKQLPPVLRLLTKWSKDRKLDLVTLITRKPVYVNRRPVTAYSLTDEGRAKFAGMVTNAIFPNGKESNVNTS